MNEYVEWREVESFPNYLVSEFGDVINQNRNRLLHQYSKLGYLHVNLSHDGFARPYKVHRIVAEAFLPNPFGKRQVNHIDGDKTNNCVDNLEWNTSSENLQHAFRIGLKQVTNRRRVRIVETGEVFESLTDCAIAIDGKVECVSRCLSGTLKTHRGYTFEPA